MSDDIGPDRIIPSDDLITWKADGAVKIRKTKDWPANKDTMSLPTLIKKTCESVPSQIGLAVKRDGMWKKWTYKEYYRDSYIAGKALVALGLEPFHGVSILGFNSPEWFFAEIGCIMAGGFVSIKRQKRQKIGLLVGRVLRPAAEYALVYLVSGQCLAVGNTATDKL